MAKTLLNSRQIDASDVEEIVEPVVAKLPAIDPFRKVVLFNDQGQIAKKGLEQLFDVAEDVTEVLNITHAELHRLEEGGSLTNPFAPKEIGEFLENLHKALHVLHGK